MREREAAHEQVRLLSRAQVRKDRRGWLSRAINCLKLPAPIEVRREAEVTESLRRQFASVNVGTMPPGRYVVELRVRDLLSGEQASSLAAFTLGK